jgi:hypothetical protein
MEAFMNRRKTLATVAAAGLSVAIGFTAWSTRSDAADHLDPPSRTDPTANGMDRNADIADIYAWHRGEGANRTLVAILSFAGPNNPVAGQRIPCDRDVLYTIHIDNTGDAVPELNLRARFAQDQYMNCFVRWEGLPGTTRAVVAPVEAVRDFGGVKVYAGLRDDAFFFDLQGFRTTLMTGTLSFANDRDFFAGKNTSALAVEMPLASALGTGMRLKIWATTARINN